MRRIDEIRAEIVANPAQRKLPINLRENSSIDAKWLTSLKSPIPFPLLIMGATSECAGA